MHLAEVLSLRQVPAAGMYLSLTRRCPLTCAHCSTNSTVASEQYPGQLFLNCVQSFTPTSRPEVVVLTGGEPLLRPRLVRQLAEAAHQAGARVVLASGMFFARQPAVPQLIARAIDGCDHFAVSLDVFHEQQVPRASVFRVVKELVDRNHDVSFLVVGLNNEDPYLADAIGDIRTTFNDRVPILVGLVGAVGRAKDWMGAPEPPPHGDTGPFPCDLASWPVVTYDGTVVACCNQRVVDGPVPAHLRLGHTSTDGWAVLKERYLSSPMMRAIRLFGPQYIASHYGSGTVGCDGYCATCYKLSDDPRIAIDLEPVMNREAMRVMEKQVALLQQEVFVDRRGLAAYTHLTELGYRPAPGVPSLDIATSMGATGIAFADPRA
jgi:pyruvate-formate lyase-activating enzyme